MFVLENVHFDDESFVLCLYDLLLPEFSHGETNSYCTLYDSHAMTSEIV